MAEQVSNGDDGRRQLGVDDLIALARDRSSESRTRLVQIVGDLFFDSGRVLSDRERSHMTEILRHLVQDVEKSVRRALADRLAEVPSAPAELVVMLANDDIEVAYPILVQSAVLQDVDLIEIIHNRTHEHRLAIAIRESVSEPVSDALVGTGETDVIKSLLENASSSISQATMEYLVEESRRIDSYRNPLVLRHDLSPALARRMYWWVSAALRNHILENYEIDPTELEETVEGAVTELMTHERIEDPPLRKSAELAERLSRADKITPAMLVETLRDGEVALFQDMFARFTGLDVQVVRRAIIEPGGGELAIVCKAAGIKKPDFTSIFLMSRSARPGDKVVDPSELSAAVALYDRINTDSAKKVLRRWRLDPDFLFALRQLDPCSAKQPGARRPSS